MPRKAILILAALIASVSLGAEGVSAYIPEKSAAKATRLLTLIDQLSATIESKRSQARADQLRAEADAVEAYALAASSRGSQEAWARPDGSLLSASAPQAYAAARARAKEAGRLIAGRSDAKAEEASLPALLASREASADSLAQLVLASGIGQKSSVGLEKLLAARSKALAKLFPEAVDAAALLSKAGAAGAREAAAAMSHRDPGDIARSLIASKERILALVPVAAASLAKLEAPLEAYSAWQGAAPVAAYPGDLASASAAEKAALAAGVLAVTALPPERAASLFAAMAEGDGRDSAAAESARGLSLLWQRLPELRRAQLSSLCGLPDYALALLSSTLSAAGEARSSRTAGGNAGGKAGAKTPKPSDWLSIMSALNALEVAIADDESRGSGPAQGAEPALILLERPELEAVAETETRYASLSADASRRIGSLYAQAAADASTRLEASPSLAKAAALALGSASSGGGSASSGGGSTSSGGSARVSAHISVRAVDLKMPSGGGGRRLAFFAVATDDSGASVSLPLTAAAAASEYAAAFVRAARLGSTALAQSRANPSPALAAYGQCVVTAYDPEGSNDTLTIDSLPKDGGPAPLGGIDLELALLGGWKP